MTIRVVVVDDHEVVRSGVTSLFEATDIEVVAEAADGKEAVEASRKYEPDVVLLDIRMEDNDGLAALEQIRRELPETRVVMFSTYDNPTYVARSVALGTSDYVLKGSSRERLLGAIRSAAAGEGPPADSLINEVRSAMLRRHDPVNEKFPVTSRELQVLRHIALGLSNREIATSLTISIETVKEHVQNILRKIGATDRTQAAVWAVKKGLV